MMLSGKRAVVTGAASGMGRAIARAFCAAGADVVALDRDEAGLEALRQEQAVLGVTLISARLDLLDEAAIDRTMADIEGAGGALDILVNNAGIMDSYQGLADLDLEIWQRVMAVNLNAPMRVMRAALPGMLARGAGSIINVASASATSGAAAGAAYTASKHGLLGLSRSTAWLYAKRGVRCNTLMPGWTETNIAASITDAGSEADVARLRDFQRLAPYRLDPVDIAQISVFLASDLACHVNGAEIAVDGGWMAA